MSTINYLRNENRWCDGDSNGEHGEQIAPAVAAAKAAAAIVLLVRRLDAFDDVTTAPGLAIAFDELVMFGETGIEPFPLDSLGVTIKSFLSFPSLRLSWRLCEDLLCLGLGFSWVFLCIEFCKEVCFRLPTVLGHELGRFSGTATSVERSSPSEKPQLTPFAVCFCTDILSLSLGSIIVLLLVGSWSFVTSLELHSVVITGIHSIEWLKPCLLLPVLAISGTVLDWQTESLDVSGSTPLPLQLMVFSQSFHEALVFCNVSGSSDAGLLLVRLRPQLRWLHKNNSERVLSFAFSCFDFTVLLSFAFFCSNSTVLLASDVSVVCCGYWNTLLSPKADGDEFRR